MLGLQQAYLTLNTFRKYLGIQHSELPVLMLATVWALSGCSGSGEPLSSDIQQTTIEPAIPVDSDSNLSTQEPIVAEADTTIEVTSDESSNELALSDSGSPIVIDPLTQNRIFVSFEITVPAYQSNELRLEVVWGDMNITAAWVGDEFWTVSSELPSETEELLTITFFDNDGAIELASFSQQFRTGSNAMEALQISADQFDTEQFDDDGDGVSNLDELVAGNDPSLDEDSLLEIRDFFRITAHSVTVNLESLLSEERPISVTNQEQVSFNVTVDTDIQIDIDGNGTLTRNRNFSCEIDRLSGIRTNMGDAISWEANRIQNDCDFTLDVDLVNTVTIVDESTRTFEQELVGRRFGSFTNDWEDSTRLTARLVDGTSMCEAVSGTHSSRFTARNSGNTTTTIFVSKEIDDPYWRVERERNRLEFSSGIVESTLLENTEFFVRELSFGESLNFGDPNPENPELFICDFVDI